MSDFKVGLIGCGGIANMHATVLTEGTKRTDLVAFCDVANERAEEFNAKYAGGKGAVYSDFAQMFDKEKLDIVYICLPPFAHSHEVAMAAERGVHVFIEKPIALNMEKANSMVAAVNKGNVKSQVGFMNRFGEAVEKVKALVDSGEAGQPGWALGTYKCNSLHGPWWRQKEKSGGQVVEQIIHTYDIIRYFLGEPAAAFCFSDNLYHKDVPNYTSEDVSAASLKFQNGAVATVAGTNGGIPGKWLASYSLVCRNLTVDFIDANNATIYRTDKDPVETIEVKGSRNLGLAETLDLLDAIEKGGATRTPMSEGAKTLAMVLAVTQSGDSGQVVRL